MIIYLVIMNIIKMKIKCIVQNKMNIIYYIMKIFKNNKIKQIYILINKFHKNNILNKDKLIFIIIYNIKD